MAFISTHDVLLANAVQTYGPIQPGSADTIVGSVVSDQGGTLLIEQSWDNVNFDISKSITVVANTAQALNEVIYLPFVRLKYTNGGTNQGVFRLYLRSVSAGARP